MDIKVTLKSEGGGETRMVKKKRIKGYLRKKPKSKGCCRVKPHMRKK